MREKIFPAVPESLPAATAFIEEQLEALGCPAKAQMQIDVAVDECFSNIARYAYDGAPGEAAVRFDFDAAASEARITFTDSGRPFDPLAAEEPDVSLSAEERPVGGLGILLVKRTMDSVQYRYEKGCNVLTIRKKIR